MTAIVVPDVFARISSRHYFLVMVFLAASPGHYRPPTSPGPSAQLPQAFGQYVAVIGQELHFAKELWTLTVAGLALLISIWAAYSNHRTRKQTERTGAVTVAKAKYDLSPQFDVTLDSRDMQGREMLRFTSRGPEQYADVMIKSVVSVDAAYLCPIETMYFGKGSAAAVSGGLGQMIPGLQKTIPFRRAQDNMGGAVIFKLECRTETGSTKEVYVRLELDGRIVPATWREQLNEDLALLQTQVALVLEHVEGPPSADAGTAGAYGATLPTREVAVTALNAQLLEKAVQSREVIAVTANRKVRAILVPITASELTRNRLLQDQPKVVANILRGLEEQPAPETLNTLVRRWEGGDR